ncbi:hypothetical protein GNIT_2870 [Glaciecola nitratireducens FR1064]|uniref:Uncharacterized protein n=1 Tax=Glaciecola nitratireducens (strain JCM 12485 / KCTC 12276 / FR1064) TaxID=1085623 RepID=G4QML5_GLANF|nr:hypothetical protein GNIT_2870 [Glaciecola nitratireducens FR1064]
MSRIADISRITNGYSAQVTPSLNSTFYLKFTNIEDFDLYQNKLISKRQTDLRIIS